MKPRGPALLFEKIKGYSPGYRVFTNGIGSYSRLALALVLAVATLVKELTDYVQGKNNQAFAPDDQRRPNVREYYPWPGSESFKVSSSLVDCFKCGAFFLDSG